MVEILGEKPITIYKYASIDVLKIILKEQTLKFSCPTEFNDPFDCDVDLVAFNFKGNVNTKVVQEIEILKRIFKNNNQFVSNENNKSFWENVYRGAQIEKINSSRICCFSLQNDIVLMWSHYAEKHYGVCLEFDNSLKQRFKNLTDEDISEGHVAYEAYNKINYVAEDRLYAIFKLFLNKSESWSHEKEYRMILINNKPEIQKFIPKFLNAIYFGIKVPNEQIKYLINEFNSNEFEHLKFYKGYKDNLSIKFLQIQR